ncbi:MAG: protoporphyrinogen oxidase [Actinomycetales bacterium]|nr:protoporphyrinogen oxidase [Actinomycetales bacterium]
MPTSPIAGQGGACGTGPHVLVVGAGISGLAAADRLVSRGARVTLLEAGRRPGGVIASERLGGFVVEAGPETLLTARPEVARLVTALGLAERVVPGRRTVPPAQVLRDGERVPLPDGLAVLVPQRLLPVLTSELLPWRARLRAAAEILVPRCADTADESLRSFVTRRLGPRAYEWLAEPLAGTLHPGEVGELSLRATFPQLHRDEAVHGGLARAVLHRRRTWGRSPVPREGEPGLPPASTLRTGTAELVEALHRRLADRAEVRLGTPALSLHRMDGGYLVRIPGTDLPADAVVLAVPTPRAARICAALDPELTALLDRMPVATSLSVVLAFREADLPGAALPVCCHVAATEGRATRSISIPSLRYPGRAPGGTVLVRVALRADRAGQDDDAQLVARARDELREILGLSVGLLWSRVHRHEDVLPRYTVGHQDRVLAVRDRLRSRPGLAVAGSGYDGAGIPDCIASGRRAADAVLDRSTEQCHPVALTTA